MNKSLLLIVFILSLGLSANAQQYLDFNVFNGSGELRSVYIQRHRLSDSYTLNLDAGSYLGLGSNVWTRWGFRGSVQRTISEFYKVDIGFMYNRVHFFDEDVLENKTLNLDITRHEFRPHQTLSVSYPRFKSSVLQHRLRLEERIFTHVHKDVRDFKMRLRYRVMHQGRFDGRPIAPKSLFYRSFAEFNFNVYEEAEDVFWVRGRYCLGIGYQISSTFSTDLNYFFEHTKVARNIDQVLTHIIQFSLRHTIYWNKRTTS